MGAPLVGLLKGPAGAGRTARPARAPGAVRAGAATGRLRGDFRMLPALLEGLGTLFRRDRDDMRAVARQTNVVLPEVQHLVSPAPS